MTELRWVNMFQQEKPTWLSWSSIPSYLVTLLYYRLIYIVMNLTFFFRARDLLNWLDSKRSYLFFGKKRNYLLLTSFPYLTFLLKNYHKIWFVMQAELTSVWLAKMWHNRLCVTITHICFPLFIIRSYQPFPDKDWTTSITMVSDFISFVLPFTEPKKTSNPSLSLQLSLGTIYA